MTRRIAAIGALFLAAAGYPAAAQVDAALGPDETLLEVQGEGRVTYAPDVAYLTIGVVSSAPSVREATTSNSRDIAGVIAALRKAGVEERHIRTQQINVSPRFGQQSQRDFAGQIGGYVATNSLFVTLIKLDRAPEIITAAFEANANSVSGPTLASLDKDKMIAEARAAAIADAREEADTYAKSLCMKVARILRVSERGNASRPVMVGASRVIAPPLQQSTDIFTTPVMRGEMERTATVWIDYALTPLPACK